MIYPSLEGAMKEAGLTNVQTKINRRQNMFAQYIATRPLLELCKGAGNNEVVGPDRCRLGEGKSEGSGNGIGV